MKSKTEAKIIILPGSGEVLGGRHSFFSGPATSTAQNDHLAHSLVIRKHFARGDDAFASLGPTPRPVMIVRAVK